MKRTSKRASVSDCRGHQQNSLDLSHSDPESERVVHGIARIKLGDQTVEDHSSQVDHLLARRCGGPLQHVDEVEIIALIDQADLDLRIAVLSGPGQIRCIGGAGIECSVQMQIDPAARVIGVRRAADGPRDPAQSKRSAEVSSLAGLHESSEILDFEFDRVLFARIDRKRGQVAFHQLHRTQNHTLVLLLLWILFGVIKKQATFGLQAPSTTLEAL